MFGPFDKYFDFDHDGELSGRERAAEIGYLNREGFFSDPTRDISREVDMEDDYDQDDYDDDLDDYDGGDYDSDDFDDDF